jgi:hypothetical protein
MSPNYLSRLDMSIQAELGKAFMHLVDRGLDLGFPQLYYNNPLLWLRGFVRYTKSNAIKVERNQRTYIITKAWRFIQV